MDNKRNDTIDIIKGIAVLLVIYGHVIQILYTGTGRSFFSDNIEKFICSFHMPLFSLISGYLFYKSYRRKTVKELFVTRILGLIQPLIIWGSVYYFLYQILLKFLGGGADLNIKEWWETISGPFLWFLWSMIAASVCVILSEQFKKFSNLLMIAMIFLAYIFPNSEYNVFMYPFFVCGFLYHKYDDKIKKYMMKNVSYYIILIFILMLFFYDEKHYIYTTGVSLAASELSWKEQLNIDIFRYVIGLAGSISVIVLIEKFSDKLSCVIRKILVLCGRKSLEIYILQCMIVSWLFSMFYSNIALRVMGDKILRIFENVFIIDFLFAPLITVGFSIIIVVLLKILNNIQNLNKFLFSRK